MDGLLILEKKTKRREAGLCMNCGKNPCGCKSSNWLPKRPNGKRGKRKGRKWTQTKEVNQGWHFPRNKKKKT